MLVYDRKELDIHEISMHIKEKWFDRRLLNINSFMRAYYKVEPCVIVEELITEIASGVDEYKFFFFHGEPIYVYHSDNHFCKGRNTNCTVSFFDLKWNNLGIQYGKHTNNPLARKPHFMKEMKNISRILSKEFSFVRVDFFETNERFYLAELSFSQGAGLVPYNPDSFDFELGRRWKI
ncbi:MAG: hypothetical protein K5697_17035 [Lachnospiraceae bacterium]|nr:hypothetical protein [Lachnospiraceae bacterium]